MEMSDLIKKIEFILEYPVPFTNSRDYEGIEMSGLRDFGGMEESRKQNYVLLKRKFPEYFTNLTIENFSLWSWKGAVWWGEEKGFGNDEINNFTGWATPKIIEWLIKNKPWIKEENITRSIDSKKRFSVLKKQNWRCNICGTHLKFSSKHEIGDMVAHIDHIHPYSQRKSYSNGLKNINEIPNLQALCPSCNLKKRDKNVH